jgi:TRAP-type mannitol/chloroaromatic compound transport system permease small subunit
MKSEQTGSRIEAIISGMAKLVEALILWFCGSMILLLMVSIVAEVGLWTLWNRPMAWLRELQWHFYGFAGMMGMSYSLLRGGHVKVDLFVERWGAKVQRMVETVGILVFMVPFSGFLIVHGMDLVALALKVGEVSAVDGGLQARWIPKAFIPVGSATLIASGFLRVAQLWVLPHDNHPLKEA